MKVFVAGASGAVGKRLVPQLVAAGHNVVGMSRSADSATSVRALGAVPVAVDAFDRDALVRAITDAAPDVLVHQLTALTGVTDFKNFDQGFALTNRLRTEATDNLLAGVRAAGTKQVIAQSYGNWPYARTGATLKGEDDPFDPDPPRNQTQALAAIRYLERAVLGLDGVRGVVLRYGNLYGPGTAFALDGALVAAVRRWRLPIVGSGAGVWSFTHVDDAASAVVAAIRVGASGVYNIVDDEPAPVAVWLPELAHAVGAKPPWRVPVWLGRLFAGEVGVSMMTRIRGASNAKAKRELGWTPRYSTWRDGFRTGTR